MFNKYRLSSFLIAVIVLVTSAIAVISYYLALCIIQNEVFT
ncbi:MAG: hypothetical protein ACI4M3_01585 [Acutalibacteraceae bacterium]